MALFYNREALDMVRLRVTEILEERGMTEDWLFRRIGMTDCRSFRKLIHNESSRIRFETISKICSALDVPVGELFVSTDEMREG